MSTRHTAGPWAVNEFVDLDGDHHIQVCLESNGCPIASVRWCGSETRPNARLIAAAPDLLAALRAIAFAFEVSIHDHEDSGAYQSARAAIEKATRSTQ